MRPSGVRKNPVTTSVAGAQAVSFNGFDASVGETYDLFIHDGFLNEASAYKELQPLLDKILAAWIFTPSEKNLSQCLVGRF
jgi:hypothetical protein